MCLNEVTSAIKDNTVLVTIMAANNETGVIQPIEAIGQLVKEINTARKLESQTISEDESEPAKTFVPLFYHVDAAQIIGKGVLKHPGLVNVQNWFAHYVTIVGHKFYGPRIGALYVKSGIPLSPWLHGGGQESGRRSGTENTFDCIGLGAAAQISFNNREKIGNRLLSLRVYLERKLIKTFEHTSNQHENFKNSMSSLSTATSEKNSSLSKSSTHNLQTTVTNAENGITHQIYHKHQHENSSVRINFQASKRLPNTVNCAFMDIPDGKTSRDLVQLIQDRVIIATGAACGFKGDEIVTPANKLKLASPNEPENEEKFEAKNSEFDPEDEILDQKMKENKDFCYEFGREKLQIFKI